MLKSQKDSLRPWWRTSNAVSNIRKLILGWMRRWLIPFRHNFSSESAVNLQKSPKTAQICLRNVEWKALQKSGEFSERSVNL
jgi:hypothetical protein